MKRAYSVLTCKSIDEEKREIVLAGSSKKLRFESLEETGDSPRLNVTLIVPLDEIEVTLWLDEDAKCPKP